MTPKRLGRLFDGIVLAALATPAIVAACSSSEESPGKASGGNAGAGGNDASVDPDAGDPVDACAVYVSDVQIIVYPDGNGTCHAYHRHPCGIPEGVTMADACVFNLNDCLTLCPVSGAFDCYAAADSCQDGSVVSGPATVSCDFCSTNVGRRPRGLRRRKPRKAASPLGDYFARIAHLEAASVFAFATLGDDLDRLGAPKSLLAAISRAEKDERRHARLTAAIARRFGGRAASVEVARRRRNTLLEVALENAVEGCVRETFGALVSTWQAAQAQDEKIARSLGSIARDETRHASLSWRILGWCEPRLSSRERARLRRALARAKQALARELAEPDHELVTLAGVPTLLVQQKLFAALDTELWAT